MLVWLRRFAPFGRLLALCLLAVLADATSSAAAGTGRAPSASPASPLRWTDDTPDAMIDDAAFRALAPGAAPLAEIATIATIASLAPRGRAGHAEDALEHVAAASRAAEKHDDAALVARMLAAEDGTEAGVAADEALGVVTALSILGPFRDTGGGLDTHDGPEANGGRSFGDMRARYSWGTYEVAWRAAPRVFASAQGVPLGLFVFPRKESCTWVATKLTTDHAQKLVVRLAAAGQARFVFDGVDLAHDASVRESALFDRFAARVQATAGDHLLAAKVCSGALDDDGRVRLRVTDEAGAKPAGVTASADLAGVSGTPPKSKLGIDPLTTKAAIALADAGATQETALEVAIVQTLGGQDDLRSPRAPGILASLAEQPLDSDRLAMAAWIAPSGANRSAWLAHALSSESIDEKTRAFATRRLVERHVEAGLADWAMASLRGAHLDTAADAEAVLLTAEVETALGTDALRISALRRLASMTRADDQAPDAVLSELGDVAASLDPPAAAAARNRLAARGNVDADWVTALESQGKAAVLAAATRVFGGGLTTAEDGEEIAASVARAGMHEEALSFYEKLARWAPNRAPVWAELAHEASAIPSDATRDQTIAAALRRARDLDPGEARYRAEIALRSRASAPSEPHDDEKYLVSSQTILARRQGVRHEGPDGKRDGTEPPPDVADRELHWLRAVVMHPDRRVSELVHYAREIVIAPRTEDELYEEIPAEGDLTEIVRARVHRKDGGTAYPVEEANDNAHPRIRWSELSPGDVVEVAFRSWTAGPVGGRGDPPFYRLDYAGALSTHPVLYNEVDVESPPEHPIYVDVVNGKATRRDEKDENGRHVLRLVWDHPANVADEPLAPPLSEVIPTLVLSTFRDWSAFRAWYGEAVRGFTEPDAQVKKLAAKLTAGKATRDEKLRAIFDFVSDDIRYVNYVSGEWWLPNRPQQLLARREGDCDDKAILLITLLSAVGIDAKEVLVQTRLTGEPAILRAPGAAIPLFDHGIAFLPGPNGGTYLDATSPESRIGPLPSMDARAVALRMDGPAEIVELPSSNPSDHGVDSTWTIALRPDGGADLQGEERALGDDAFWMRTYLTEPGARASWVEDHLVGNWFSTVEVDKKVDFKGDLARGAAVLDWRARASGLARHEGNELVVPLSSAQPIASQIAPLVSRTLPVWLPPHIAPRKESRTIRVVAPTGFTFGALPPGGDENGGPFGSAHLEVSPDPHDPRAILVRRTVVFDRSKISVEEYPKWRAWVQHVDALLHRNVRLVAVSASGPARPVSATGPGAGAGIGAGVGAGAGQ
ncbi:MAG TPA: transglutaminase domain-containing protein [Polyangiaceae bacterium]|nr:transglutaminase domain-containing protein [Polyangiaceae bacterium]